MPTQRWMTDQSLRFRSYATGKMCVILEGPDFAGKSTLASEILEHHISKNRSAGIIHNGPPPIDHQFNSLVDLYIDQVLHPRWDVTIIDRHYVGELIYGAKYRGLSKIGDSGRGLIENALTHANAIRIFLDESDETLLERFRGERGDDVVTKELDLLEIADRYRDLIGSDIRWLRWTPEVEKMVKW